MVIIIGAGLSGLLTAYLLKKEGIPFKILEARNRIGGRIHTIYEENQAPIEIGATWFTEQHKHIFSLLEELNIGYFQQSMGNTVFYEVSSTTPSQVVKIPEQAPSFRISGGSSSVINALFNELDESDIHLNQSVKEIRILENSICVSSEQTFEGDSVVLAVPPKLWSKNMVFAPPLPSELIRVATETQTWMEDSIKIALTYEKPFWGEEDLPGTLFSNLGPIVELYDHSNHEKSQFALCGFIDSNAKHLSTEERRKRVIKQLEAIFGKKALAFTNYEECLWSKEENTFQTSEVFLAPHQNNGNPIFHIPLFNGKLLISSTESASEFAGYMEGAVISAYSINEKIKKNR